MLASADMKNWCQVCWVKVSLLLAMLACRLVFTLPDGWCSLPYKIGQWESHRKFRQSKEINSGHTLNCPQVEKTNLKLCIEGRTRTLINRREAVWPRSVLQSTLHEIKRDIVILLLLLPRCHPARQAVKAYQTTETQEEWKNALYIKHNKITYISDCLVFFRSSPQLFDFRLLLGK